MTNKSTASFETKLTESTDKDSTRTVILDVAARLFAEDGFEGTSIRAIAKEADVNLAAINYHFTNKENLYREVFRRNYDWLSFEIDQLGKHSTTTLDFCQRLFDFLQLNSTPLLNSFKIITTNNSKLFDDDMVRGKVLGPPGGETMLAVITREVGAQVPLARREWMMRVLFTHLVHGGIMMATSLYKHCCVEIPNFGQDQKRQDIELLVASVLAAK